jgi:hypothetical protein
VVLLATGTTLAAVALLAAWGTESPDRARYDQIQVGMTDEEVHSLLSGWTAHPVASGFAGHTAFWLSPDGATTSVRFSFDGRVTGKRFEAGDPSFTARARRLMRRLPFR